MRLREKVLMKTAILLIVIVGISDIYTKWKELIPVITAHPSQYYGHFPRHPPLLHGTWRSLTINSDRFENIFKY